MNFIKTFLSTKLWLNLLMIAVVSYGVYYLTYEKWLSSYTKHGEEIEVPDLSSLSISDALQKLDDLNMTYEVDSIRYDPNFPAYTVLDFYPFAGFKVKEGRKVFIKSNPKTWRPVELPNLIGKSKRLAFTQLTVSGLAVGDTIYEPDIAKDAVLRVLYKGKEIETGSVLPRFSKVDLVLGRGLLTGVTIPNFINLNIEDTKMLIQQNYFEIGKVTYLGKIDDSANVKVIYQYPLPRDYYDQGLPVDLWVSNTSRDSLKTNIRDLDRRYKNFTDSIISAPRPSSTIEEERPIPDFIPEEDKKPKTNIPVQEPSVKPHQPNNEKPVPQKPKPEPNHGIEIE